MPSARTRRGGGSAAAEPPPHPANSWRKKPGSTSRGDWPRRCRKKTASKIRNGNLWHRTWPRGLLADVVARAAYPPSRHACWCVAMGRALSLPHPGGRRPLATNPPNTLSTSTGDGPRRRWRKPSLASVVSCSTLAPVPRRPWTDRVHHATADPSTTSADGHHHRDVVASGDDVAVVVAVGARGRGVGGGVVYPVCPRAARHGGERGARSEAYATLRGPSGRSR